MKNFEITHLPRIRGGALVLSIALPLFLYLVVLTHVSTVDMTWLYEQRGITANSPETRELLSTALSQSTFWHSLKQGFWQVVLLFSTLIFTILMGLSSAQLFSHFASLSTLARGIVWSQAFIAFDILLGLAHIAASEFPTRILTKDLFPSSWNSILGLAGDGPLQMYTSFHGPSSLLGLAFLAWYLHREAAMSRVSAIACACLSLGTVHALLLYILAVKL